MTTFLDHIKANGKAIDAEVAAVFKKYGITVTGRSATVDAADGSYKFKISYATSEGVEVKLQKDRSTFLRYCGMWNMPPEWFGKKFRSGSKVFAITGVDPKKRAKPIMLDCGGKTYFAAPDYVRSFMIANPVA